jgi:hypothetical protein
VEAHDIAEQIHEHAAPGHEHPTTAPGHDWFRRLTGVYLGFVAMLLAIASLGGASATKEMLNANIHASDTYAFYQAKYIRQLHYQTAAEQLEVQSEAPELTGERRGKIDQLVKRYRETAARDESNPASGTGKKELLEKARKWEETRDHAAAQTPNFEYAEALFQIAIVLGSVAIVAASPWLLGISGVLAVGGTISMRGDWAISALSGADLVEQLPNAAGSQLEVETLLALPSAQLTLSDALEVAVRDCTGCARGEGVVVATGTDVMEELAVLCALMYDGQAPIVLTGAEPAGQQPWGGWARKPQ